MKNDKAKYLILGNSTAAISAIEWIRKVDAKTPIVLLAKEPYHTYSRPLISYLLAGEVDDEKMFYRPPDFYERNSVDVRLGVEAVSIDTDKRTVTTVEGKRIVFENLLIATGGDPFVPEVKGIDCKGVFTFTSWDDTKAIDRYISQYEVGSALVVGGGLIGIKAAEALTARDIDVHWVELADRLLPLALDEKGSEYAAAVVEEAGVHLECSTTIERIISHNGAMSGAVLRTGEEISCRMIIVAVGVVPNISILNGSGIEVDRGILIDKKCRTNVEGVYAAGDVAQGKDSITGLSHPIPIFPNAYRQGSVAGVNMAGGIKGMDYAFAMNSVEIFGLPTISVGLANAPADEYEIMERSDDSSHTHKRIALQDNRIVGALFVGDIERAGIMTGLIRGCVNVSSFKDILLTDRFGLISLPTEYRTHLVRGEGIEV